MCPACIATVGWIAAGVASTGGVTELVLSRRRGKRNKDNQNEAKDMETPKVVSREEEDKGETIWQRAKRETRSTRKGISR
jgi:hypothetical protein